VLHGIIIVVFFEISLPDGDKQTILLLAIKRFTKVKAVNLKERRRFIAKKVIEENKYCY
jgi:hypothetical protein